jgi:ribonuclease D
MDFEIITTRTALESLVDHVADSPWLALDTEFMRESSYYSKLCLIQIASEHACACIDVLALENIDIFLDLLADQSKIKIFHSGRQDLEVFYTQYNFIPTPIFDTQIAASMLLANEQIGYGELVENILQVKLAKTESRTDWSKRPLTAAQHTYALDDVRYLGALYSHMHEALVEKQRLSWLEEECAALSSLTLYQVDPDEMWKNVKGIGRVSQHALPYIKQLAAWREKLAQQRDRPRQWILSDRAIMDLSQLQPLNRPSIAALLNSEYPKFNRYLDTIVAEIEQLTAAEQGDATLSVEDRRLDKQQQDRVKRLMKHIRQRAKEIGITPSLLANRKSIEQLIRGEPSRVTFGWRQEQIGKELLALIDANA